MMQVRRIVVRDGQRALKYARGPFLTDALERGRSIVVTLHPQHLTVRLHGTRQELTLPYAAIYLRAAADEARSQRAERITRRKQRAQIRRGALATGGRS